MRHWPFYMGPDVRRGTDQAAEVDISYRLDASQLNIPVAVTRVEGQLVSYDKVAGSLSPDRTVGSLRILFPCADAPPGYARAEVQIDAAPLPKTMQIDEPAQGSASWYQRLSPPRESTATVSHETWALNLPKAELDQLLGVLATPGSVTTVKQAQSAGAALTTHFNGHHCQGACRPVPELDALMRRIRDHGQLVAYSRPLTAQSQRLQQMSSVALFREDRLQEIDGVVDPHQNASTQLAQTSGLAAPTPAAWFICRPAMAL